MALNDPRTVPYAFHVVELEGWVWLYDDSVHTFICDTVPKLWLEPLYSVEEGEHEDCPPESNYFAAGFIAHLKSFPIELDAEYITADVDKKEAWDDAREEACGNHVI